MRRRSRLWRIAAGFTLVEMLVSMVLLSMVMLALVSVMRSMGQAQERVDHRLDVADDIRVKAAFVQATLGHVSTRRSSRAVQAGENPYEFWARPQELIWVGVMPARFGMGGRSYFRLALESSPTGASAVLRFAPWDGKGVSDWSGAQAYPLGKAVTSFSLAYEDARQPVPLWVDAWQRTDSIPARVRITLTTDAGPQPLWIVALRQLPASQIGGARFTTGGE